MNKFYVFFLLFIINTTAIAKIAYVTNNLDLPLRSNESSKGKVISLLPIGTAVEVIKENAKTGFSQVQLKNGQQGYLATNNTTSEPPGRSKPGTIAANLGSMQTENNALKEEIAKLKVALSPDTPLEQSLATERDRLERELIDLKRTTANQIQIKSERDSFQEELIQVKRDYEQLKLENTALKDGAKQDWFLYGGLLALAGVLMGFILPKLDWHRKDSWNRI